MESCEVIQPIFVFVCSLMVWRLVESCSRVYEDILKEETSISGQTIFRNINNPQSRTGEFTCLSDNAIIHPVKLKTNVVRESLKTRTGIPMPLTMERITSRRIVGGIVGCTIVLLRL